MNATKKLQIAKQKLRDLQRDRQRWLRAFKEDDPLIAGSYAEVFIRCGQPTCHCHKEGEKAHFATRLSRWVHGKLKQQIVKVADRLWVKEASDRYKTHKAVLRKIQKLHLKEEEFIKRLIKLKIINYP